MKSVEITYSFHPSALPPTPLPANTEAARRRLEEGNRLFVTLLDQIKRGAATERHIMRLDPRHLGLLPGETGAPEQRPFAAVVGCADARVPIELIFSEGPNDLFVIRVAGNGLGSDVLGSLSYAVDSRQPEGDCRSWPQRLRRDLRGRGHLPAPGALFAARYKG